MTKKEIIKIIQEEERRIWIRAEHYRKHKVGGDSYQSQLSEWNAISTLMEKLDIKSIS